MDDPDRLRLAYHEAGHVLAAVTINVPVGGVTLASADGMAAHTAGVPPVEARRTRDALLVMVCDTAVIAAAGAAGEGLWWDSYGAALGADPGLAARIRDASSAADDAKLDQLAALAAELSDDGDGTGSGPWIARRKADAAGIVAVGVPRVGFLAACLARAGSLTAGEIGDILGVPGQTPSGGLGRA